MHAHEARLRRILRKHGLESSATVHDVHQALREAGDQHYSKWLDSALGSLSDCWSRPAMNCLRESLADLASWSEDQSYRRGIVVSGLAAIGRLSDSLFALSDQDLVEDYPLYDDAVHSYQILEFHGALSGDVREGIAAAIRAAELAFTSAVSAGPYVMGQFQSNGLGNVWILDENQPSDGMLRGPRYDDYPGPLPQLDLNETDIENIRGIFSRALFAANHQHLIDALATFSEAIRQVSPARMIQFSFDCLSGVCAPSPGETGFKVAMRVAALVGTTAEERLESYAWVSRAGAVRNSVSHPRSTIRAVRAFCETLSEPDPMLAARRFLTFTRDAILAAGEHWTLGLTSSDWEEWLNERLLRGSRTMSNVIPFRTRKRIPNS